VRRSLLTQVGRWLGLFLAPRMLIPARPVRKSQTDPCGTPNHDPVASPLSTSRAYLGMILSADGGVFNLAPFRGPGADGGTAFELGVFGALRDRMKRDGSATFDAASACWRDELVMSIEDFGYVEDLMLAARLARVGLPGRLGSSLFGLLVLFRPPPRSIEGPPGRSLCLRDAGTTGSPSAGRRCHCRLRSSPACQRFR
jgi:hypothetical protein